MKTIYLFITSLVISFALMYSNFSYAAIIKIDLAGQVTTVDPQIANSEFSVGSPVNISLAIDRAALDGLVDPDIGAYFDAIVAWDFNFGGYNVTTNDPTGVFVINNTDDNDEYGTIDGFGAAVDDIHSQSNDGDVNGMEFFRATFVIAFGNNAFDSAMLDELLKSSLVDREFIDFPTSGVQIVFDTTTTSSGRVFFQANATIDSFTVSYVPIPATAWLFLSAIAGIVGVRKL